MTHYTSSCLSGCFSKPQGIVLERGPACVSYRFTAVSAGVRDRRGLPEVPGGLAVGRGIRLSRMRAPACLRPAEAKTLAVRLLSAASLPPIWDGPAQHENAVDNLLLGRLSEDHRQARCF